jgi:hypothetical protein
LEEAVSVNWTEAAVPVLPLSVGEEALDVALPGGLNETSGYDASADHAELGLQPLRDIPP